MTKGARIVDTDAQGTILREGNNGFTCMPGNPKIVGEPRLCADAASLQWFVTIGPHWMIMWPFDPKT